MKILHIGKYYPPFSGGIENFMGDLLPLLTSETTQLCALVHDHSSGKLPRHEIINQVQIIRVPTYGRLLYAPISPAFPFYLHRTLKQFKPDILHIHMPNTSAFWLLFSSIARGIPWIIHWHADVIGSTPNKAVAFAYHFYRLFEQRLLKISHRVIATSANYLYSSLVLQSWKEKAHIIPLGLPQKQTDISIQSKRQAKLLWGKHKNKLLSIGRLTYYKGQKYLIEAMQDLPDTQLIIVGQGEEFRTLQSQINKLGLNKQVYLTGKLDILLLHALLDSCDIFCLPSIERTEAFGLVLLEAMHYAKPLIVSNIPGSGMTWVCQDQQTGLLSEPCNSYDIRLKIQQLLDNKDLCLQFGINGRERLKNNFNLDCVAHKTLQLYASVVSESNGKHD